MPYRGDVFRALHTATPLVRYLDHRGYDAIAVCNRLHERQARRQHRQGRKDRSLAAQLRYAREAEILAVTLADEVAALIGWLRQDILRGVGRGLRLTAARDRGTLAAAAVHARPSEQDAVDLAACGVLAGLLPEYGAPLVRKRDNGSAFRSEESERMLSRSAIEVLYLPAHVSRMDAPSCLPRRSWCDAATLRRDSHRAGWDSASAKGPAVRDVRSKPSGTPAQRARSAGRTPRAKRSASYSRRCRAAR
jgi:hypothetical protein